MIDAGTDLPVPLEKWLSQLSLEEAREVYAWLDITPPAIALAAIGNKLEQVHPEIFGEGW